MNTNYYRIELKRGRWCVINTETESIQSAWDREDDAKECARAINKVMGQKHAQSLKNHKAYGKLRLVHDARR